MIFFLFRDYQWSLNSYICHLQSKIKEILLVYMDSLLPPMIIWEEEKVSSNFMSCANTVYVSVHISLQHVAMNIFKKSLPYYRSEILCFLSFFLSFFLSVYMYWNPSYFQKKKITGDLKNMNNREIFVMTVSSSPSPNHETWSFLTQSTV